MTEAFSLATEVFRPCVATRIQFRDKILVSQQGLGLGPVWVATRISLCRDRDFPWVGHSCHDIRLYVATEIPKVVLRHDVFL